MSNTSKSTLVLVVMALVYVVLGVIGSVMSDPSLEGGRARIYFSGFVILPFISMIYARKGTKNNEGISAYLLFITSGLIFAVGSFLLLAFWNGPSF